MNEIASFRINNFPKWIPAPVSSRYNKHICDFLRTIYYSIPATWSLFINKARAKDPLRISQHSNKYTRWKEKLMQLGICRSRFVADINNRAADATCHKEEGEREEEEEEEEGRELYQYWIVSIKAFRCGLTKAGPSAGAINIDPHS